jgi:N-methylhydantoinase A/oxoprolinase/acetone carboxylase beta subunit
VPLRPELAEAFHRAHEREYGYADREREIELVAIRTADVRRAPELTLPRGRALEVEGPTLLELDGATCWIPPGWVGARDGPTLVLTRK